MVKFMDESMNYNELNIRAHIEDQSSRSCDQDLIKAGVKWEALGQRSSSDRGQKRNGLYLCKPTFHHDMESAGLISQPHFLQKQKISTAVVKNHPTILTCYYYIKQLLTCRMTGESVPIKSDSTGTLAYRSVHHH